MVLLGIDDKLKDLWFEIYYCEHHRPDSGYLTLFRNCDG